MSLLEDKTGIVTYIDTNWVETEILYSGHEYNYDDKTEWIFVQVTPEEVGNVSINTSTDSNVLLVDVAVFSLSQHRTLELTDMVIAMLYDKKIGTTFITDSLINFGGTLSDKKYHYNDLTFRASTVL